MEPLIAFESQVQFDRMSAAVRFAENMMRSPQNSDTPYAIPAGQIQIKIKDRPTADGFYPAVVLYRVFPDFSTSTTSTTTTSTTSTTSTTTTPDPNPCVSTTTSTTTTPDPNWIEGETCFVWEMNRRKLGFGCKFDGTVCAIVNGFAVVLVQSKGEEEDCEPYPTSPDVKNRCTGQCVHSWNNTTKKWDLTSSYCCFSTCKCDEPTICPSSSCAVMVTNCTSITPVKQPNCSCYNTTTTTPDPLTSTTAPPVTSTTTTTMPPGTCGGCKWQYVPGLGLRLTSMNCNNSLYCQAACLTPVLPPGVPVECIEITSECYPAVPPPPKPPTCTGFCTFVSDGAAWALKSQSCRNYCPTGGLCLCDQPSLTPGPCASSIQVLCKCPPVFTDPSTPTTPPPVSGGTTLPPTTTTLPPCTTTTTSLDCVGECYWKWNTSGAHYTLSSKSCYATCACIAPIDAGNYDCEMRVTACLPPNYTTTTTTTTTTLPPTTTTLPPTTTTTGVGTTTTTTTTPNPYDSCYCAAKVVTVTPIGGGQCIVSMSTGKCISALVAGGEDCTGPDCAGVPTPCYMSDYVVACNVAFIGQCFNTFGCNRDPI